LKDDWPKSIEELEEMAESTKERHSG